MLNSVFDSITTMLTCLSYLLCLFLSREEAIGVARVDLLADAGAEFADALVVGVALAAGVEFAGEDDEAEQVSQHESFVLLHVTGADELVEVAAVFEQAACCPFRQDEDRFG